MEDRSLARRAYVDELTETGKAAEQRSDLDIAIDKWIAIEDRLKNKIDAETKKRKETEKDTIREEHYREFLIQTGLSARHPKARRSDSELDADSTRDSGPDEQPRLRQSGKKKKMSGRDQFLERLDKFSMAILEDEEQHKQTQELAKDVKKLKEEFDQLRTEIRQDIKEELNNFTSDVVARLKALIQKGNTPSKDTGSPR